MSTTNKQVVQEAMKLMKERDELITEYNRLRSSFCAALFGANDDHKIEINIKHIEDLDLNAWTLHVHKEADSDIMSFQLVPKPVEEPAPVTEEIAADPPKLEVCPGCSEIKQEGTACLTCQERASRVFTTPPKRLIH